MAYPVVTVKRNKLGVITANQTRFSLYSGKHETVFKKYPNPYKLEATYINGLKTFQN